MKNFLYYTPTRVVFGKGAENDTGKLIKECGGKKILIHYGSGSVIRTGLLDRIIKSVHDENIAFVTLGGVVPNPRLSKVYEGIELCKKEKTDFILAVGGGSVIDSAKAIAYGVSNEGDVWDFYKKTRVPSSSVPVGVVLTIAAAGSEMSNSSVITNDATSEKRGCNCDLSRCKFAVMNPELTMTLPEYQTESGCVDIMMHTMERYFNCGENSEITSVIAEGLLRTVIKNAKILLQDPLNYNARAEIMWASSLSHNGLTGCGNDAGDWACHQLEHELGGMFDVTHGAGLAAVWPAWARYVYKNSVCRFARFARAVFDIDIEEDEKAALAGIDALEAFFREIKMPTNIRELGQEVNQGQIKTLAYNCSFKNTRTIGSVMKLNVQDIENIYTQASK